MTTDAVVDSVLTVTRAAVSGDLLSGADSLAAGIAAAGWVRNVRGGEWLFTAMPTWHLLSSDHAPNLAVFFSDEDVSPVVAVGQDLARRFDHEPSLNRRASGPGWSAWPADDPRWAEWTGSDVAWLTWEGGPARISTIVEPARQLGHTRVRPSLHLQFERLDTPLEGMPPDDDRARRVAQTGSSVARWYLAGLPALPDDVVTMLRSDEDPAVIAAVDAGDEGRALHATRRVPGNR